MAEVKVIRSRFTPYKAELVDLEVGGNWQFAKLDGMDRFWLTGEQALAAHLLVPEPCDDPDRCLCLHEGYERGRDQGRRP